jgi:ketosteroid isomerase-like protein
VSSAEESNKDLVRRFFEALAQRDLDALQEMMVPDFVNHTKLLPRAASVT